MTYFSYLDTKIYKTLAYSRKAYESVEFLISFFFFGKKQQEICRSCIVKEELQT